MRQSKPFEPKRENPILVFPVLGKPVQENPAQLNTNILNKYISSTEISNPILSYLPSPWDEGRNGWELESVKAKWFWISSAPHYHLNSQQCREKG